MAPTDTHILSIVDVNHSLSKLLKIRQKYTKDEIVHMVGFLIDNIFVHFGGRVFQQTIDIPWVLIVHNSLPMCSFIHRRQTS